MRVHRVAQVKDVRESGAGRQGFQPGAIVPLRFDQVSDATLECWGGGLIGCGKAEQGPRCLRRRALAPCKPVFTVAGAAFPPAAVTILDAEQLGGAMTDQLIDLFARDTGEGRRARGRRTPRAA